MESQRQRHENFLARRNRAEQPENVETLLLVCDACDSAIETGVLSETALRTFMDGACCSALLVWQNSVDLLRLLESKGFDLGRAFLEMSNSASASSRFAALCCLSRKTQRTVVDEILIKSIADKSSKVRCKAASAAMTFRKRWLVNAIAATLAAEKNQKARLSLDFSLALLRDGYILKQHSATHLSVTVPTAGNAITSRLVSVADLNAKGIDALIVQIQSDPTSRLHSDRSPLAAIEETRIAD